MPFEMIQARTEDIADIVNVLNQAATWQNSINQPLWEASTLTETIITKDVTAGLYYVVKHEDVIVGTQRVQLIDPVVWPDMPEENALYLHRIAVLGQHAGGGVSTFMFEWAKQHAVAQGRRFLRLDCELRPRLCAVYERSGFITHSERDVGEYHVRRYQIDFESE